MARPKGDFEKGAMRLLSLIVVIGKQPDDPRFPSNEWLAKKMERSVRTIQRYLSYLEKLRKLTRQLKRYFKQGVFKTKRLLGLIKPGEEKKPRFLAPIYVESDMTPLLPPEVQKFLDDEDRKDREAQKPVDPVFNERKQDVLYFRDLVHKANCSTPEEKKLGYSRQVKHSPRVQEILRLLERRQRGEE